MKHIINKSWLNGKYPEVEAEINGQLPYISIGDFFCQGDEADAIIDEIYIIWTKENCSVEDAIKKWESYYL